MREYNIFVSHYNKDSDEVKKLEERLRDRGYFKFQSNTIDEDSQIKSEDEAVIKRGLKRRLNNSDTLIVAIGKQTHRRKWVRWEIEEAAKMGINIIGVTLYGERDSEIPKGVERFGNSLVSWMNIDTIVDAIRGKQNWTKDRPSKINIPSDRSKC